MFRVIKNKVYNYLQTIYNIHIDPHVYIHTDPYVGVGVHEKKGFWV